MRTHAPKLNNDPTKFRSGPNKRRHCAPPKRHNEFTKEAHNDQQIHLRKFHYEETKIARYTSTRTNEIRLLRREGQKKIGITSTYATWLYKYIISPSSWKVRENVSTRLYETNGHQNEIRNSNFVQKPKKKRPVKNIKENKPNEPSTPLLPYIFFFSA